jgi:hypothetical protein
MLTLIIVLVLVAAVTFVLMRKGKIADANNNNIPDAIESKIEAVKEVVEEVKEVVAEAKKAKAPKAPKPKPEAAPKTKAPKKTK